MRRGTAIFIFINVAVILYLLHSCKTLISLLFEDGAADAIYSEEIALSYEGKLGNRTQLIPKIIHQTYVNESIPVQWIKSQQSCKNLHKDYKYMLWTDVESRKFIATEYAWFLSTFDAYPFAIQRADAIRYFVLAHYGGIYIDLDDGCNRRLDPLLYYPAWLRRTVPTGISNDVMGSMPKHPFFLKTIKSLKAYQRNWGMPYISVMYSTGPLYLSVLWKEYLRDIRPAEEHVKILMPIDYKGFEQSLFNISKGNSWHGKDARTIFWMGRHWILLTVLGFIAATISGGILWVLWNSIIMKAGRRSRWKDKERYELINRID
ncbi:Mannosyl phosphorylinositol ceramide synthase CSH1 [Golovinomyces cichoracearum]|uniref:Mannosyl phosphorylinositol ceramide synthase CSH1 n=1 Tax=Golovinomyces cichoracearum TaxID=62708 RepID=A0A420I2K0_9PEZI|nr:Mannosyl phosphorylinositol ceramide synthase CSH1 [Golovinomyces cichoracearum]